MIDRDNDLDLKKPIFVLYVNGEGYSRHNTEEKIDHYKHYLERDNITLVVIVSDRDSLEIVWNGSDYMKSDQLLQTDIDKIKKSMCKIYEVVSEDITDANIKRKLRKYLIEDILDE
jgi:hypothetical protein